jgi:hypothetical protein
VLRPPHVAWTTSSRLSLSALPQPRPEIPPQVKPSRPRGSRGKEGKSLLFLKKKKQKDFFFFLFSCQDFHRVNM